MKTAVGKLSEALCSIARPWWVFVVVLLKPWVFVTLGSSVALLVYSSHQSNEEVKIILSVIFGLGSSIAAGFATKYWLDLTEASVLVIRGKSAIRNLRLLLNNIDLVNVRVKDYLENAKKWPPAKEQELAKTYFEELLNRFQNLKEEVVNSVENWTDIIPEADVTTQIGLITNLENQIATGESEKSKLIESLEQAKSASKEERERLQNRVQQVEGDLSKTRLELAQKQLGIDTSVLGGMSGVASSTVSTASFGVVQASSFGGLRARGLLGTCPNCGKSTSPLAMTNNCTCPKLS